MFFLLSVTFDLAGYNTTISITTTKPVYKNLAACYTTQSFSHTMSGTGLKKRKSQSGPAPDIKFSVEHKSCLKEIFIGDPATKMPRSLNHFGDITGYLPTPIEIHGRWKERPNSLCFEKFGSFTKTGNRIGNIPEI